MEASEGATPVLSVLRGFIFEQLAHKKLREGGVFKVRELVEGKHTPAAVVTEVTFQKRFFKMINNLQDAAGLTSEDYGYPTAKNFGAVDAFIQVR